MTIKADYAQSFSFARMQNGIPAIRSVTLRNTDKVPLKDLRLTIRFDPALSEEYQTVVSELPARGRIILDNIKIIPSATFLANLTEIIEGSMTLTCETDGEEIAREQYPVRLLPYDFWEGVNNAP